MTCVPRPYVTKYYNKIEGLVHGLNVDEGPW